MILSRPAAPWASEWVIIAREHGRTAETDGFFRLFLVPGMNHCSGGPATDSFDVLTPLVAWVEQGRAPERIEDSTFLEPTVTMSPPKIKCAPRAGTRIA